MSGPQKYEPKDGTPVLPLFSLKGRTAIISGAGAGIGLAVADAFAEAGANVVIWYNSNKEAETRAKEIAEKYGVKCMCTITPTTSARLLASDVCATH